VLDPAYNYELEGAPDDGGHGTSVAGIIAARRNGSGVVGVAYNASITSYNIFSSRAQDEAIFLGYMRRQAAFDISSNSWGWTTPFADHRNSPLSSGYFAQLDWGLFGYLLRETSAKTALVPTILIPRTLVILLLLLRLIVMVGLLLSVAEGQMC
jgi:hypothetical protein